MLCGTGNSNGQHDCGDEPHGARGTADVASQPGPQSRGVNSVFAFDNFRFVFGAAGPKSGATECEEQRGQQGQRRDRKSTRLNSSHVAISYAVFCLKTKNST